MSILPVINQPLTLRIRDTIFAANGWISFAHFMELALYAENEGYYCREQSPFGIDGDFVTAPEISPLFAKCLANQFQEILTNTKAQEILELGAGSGKLAGDLLLNLEQLNCLPKYYFIYEISPALQKRQLNYLTQTCSHLITRIRWLNNLDDCQINGIIFANEVLDALPINIFALQAGELFERGVTWADNKFQWQLAPANALLQKAVEHIQTEITLPDYYLAEINLNLTSWLAQIAQCLKSGVLLFLDYGYGRGEYYHPDRVGTLMCSYQHQSHSDPFQYIGQSDITAHVDFTAVAEGLAAADLEILGFTTQSSFLLSCGLLNTDPNLNPAAQYNLSLAIKTLALPATMGEIIKVMAFGRNYPTTLSGFNLYDRRKDL
jgi:SAM-dependent MidA family methyltransferase